MTTILLWDIWDFLTVLEMASIIVFAVVAAYYNTLWLKHYASRTQPWVRVIKAFSLCISLLWAGIYVFTLAEVFAGARGTETNFLMAFIVRPAILLTCVNLALSANARYIAARYGVTECQQKSTQQD